MHMQINKIKQTKIQDIQNLERNVNLKCIADSQKKQKQNTTHIHTKQQQQQ